MRATPPPSSSGRHGSTANVDGSGSAIMSDSSMALKPVIEEPSKPIPPSNASSSCSALIENDFSWPRMSVNQSRMKRIPRSWTSALTSSGVVGRSVSAAIRGACSRALEPAVRPGLELAERRARGRGPSRVSSYSTRAGEAPPTRRSTIPRASSSFMRSDSSRSESAGTAWAISEKRIGPPWSITARIAPVQRLPTSSTASCRRGQQRRRAAALGLRGAGARGRDRGARARRRGLELAAGPAAITSGRLVRRGLTVLRRRAAPASPPRSRPRGSRRRG